MSALPPERLAGNSCGTTKAPDEEHDGSGVEEGLCGSDGALEVLGESAVTVKPGKGSFNGLIANGKFCLTRAARLRLSWPRARGCLRAAVPPQLLDEVTHQGGEHGTAAAHLARPADGHVNGDRPAALGPGLSAPSAVGDAASIRAGRGAGAPDPAGGTPCA